jgi:5-methylcytosine-specific restriction endonuclease McrA
MSSNALRDHVELERPDRIPAAVREAVLERDHSQCQACGTTGDHRLQLHHVQFRSAGGAHGPANLVTLCFRCHEDVHARRIDVALTEIAPGRWTAFIRRNWARRARRVE